MGNISRPTPTPPPTTTPPPTKTPPPHSSLESAVAVTAAATRQGDVDHVDIENDQMMIMQPQTASLVNRFSRASPPQPQSPSSLESAAAEAMAAGATSLGDDHVENDDPMMRTLLLTGLCFAAVSAVLQAVQTTALQQTKRTQLVYTALVISFTVFMVSVYIRLIYKRASNAGVHVGILFVSIALMVAITGGLSTPLMVVCWAVFLFGIFIIVFANYRM